MPSAISPDDVWTALEELRARRPLVHNITNYVAMSVSANILLALGASPAMVHAEDEVEEFVAASDALVINIGTLSRSWVAAMRKAAVRAAALDKPWVLDPVGCGATRYRRETALALVALAPDIIRGNAAEIMSLAGEAAAHRGVDSLSRADQVLAAATGLARRTGTVVAITGATDYACDGCGHVAVASGHALMPLSTALGCALSAVAAAFAAIRPPREAAVAALATFGAAGRAAAVRCRGPGHLPAEICDALHLMTKDTLVRHARIDVSV